MDDFVAFEAKFMPVHLNITKKQKFVKLESNVERERFEAFDTYLIGAL